MVIDLTGPKVLAPTVLFWLVSMAPIGLFLQVHLFLFLFWITINSGFKFTITKSDLIVPGVLFVALGLSKGPLMVHTILFAVLWSSLRSLFPTFF